jgi:predicted DNA-binding transcriptional regulator AlpA
MDQISCLVFLQGVVAGISTAAVHLEDEYWAAGREVSLPPPVSLGLVRQVAYRQRDIRAAAEVTLNSPWVL